MYCASVKKTYIYVYQIYYIVEVQMINLSFQTSIVSIIFYCIQKTHLLPSSLSFQLSAKKLWKVELVLCIECVRVYMLNLDLSMYPRNDIVTSLTVPNCSRMATAPRTMVFGTHPSNSSQCQNQLLTLVCSFEFKSTLHQPFFVLQETCCSLIKISAQNT